MFQVSQAKHKRVLKTTQQIWWVMPLSLHCQDRSRDASSVCQAYLFALIPRCVQDPAQNFHLVPIKNEIKLIETSSECSTKQTSSEIFTGSHNIVGHSTKPHCWTLLCNHSLRSLCHPIPQPSNFFPFGPKQEVSSQLKGPGCHAAKHSEFAMVSANDSACRVL